MRLPFVTVLCVVAFTAACSDKKKWAEKHQAAAEVAKAQLKKAADAPAAAKAEVPKDPFWDDPSLTRVSQEAACPEGLWALFKGSAVGNDAAARKENEAKRAELVKELKGKRFVTRLHAPADLKLAPYDMRKAELPLELTGVIDCTDSAGHIALAFGDARATVPRTSVVQEGAVIQQNIWASAPLEFTLPIKSSEEAKNFVDKHKFDVDARIVYRLGATEVDRKMFKQPKVKEGEIELGGGNEDWGAGRLVRTEIEAIRIATDRESTVLLDTRDKPAK
ncbi:MAG: hypothetical protein ACT4TC_08925 [Myxococcaceae bacterium]